MHIGPPADLAIGLSFSHASQVPPTGLSPAGLAIMVVSIGAILTLVVWCYGKVLRRDDRHGEEE